MSEDSRFGVLKLTCTFSDLSEICIYLPSFYVYVDLQNPDTIIKEIQSKERHKILVLGLRFNTQLFDLRVLLLFLAVVLWDEAAVCVHARALLS